MKYEVFQEQIFFSTVRICIKNSKGECLSIGSGFIYNEPSTIDETKRVILLISNKHVFHDTSLKLEYTLHKKLDRESDLPDLANHHTFYMEDFSKLYNEHPDPNIDLACVNISNSFNQGINLFTKNLHNEIFCDYTIDNLLPGSDVWFVGYPQNMFDTKHNLPIMRHGYIASIPQVNFEGKRNFIIDAQVFPGSSGSPVFSVIKGNFKFIGVIAETMLRREYLKSIQVKDIEYSEQILGLGVVIKSDCVRELITYTCSKIFV